MDRSRPSVRLDIVNGARRRLTASLIVSAGLIAALISVAIIAATTTLGINISNAFQKVADNIAK